MIAFQDEMQNKSYYYYYIISIATKTNIEVKQNSKIQKALRDHFTWDNIDHKLNLTSKSTKADESQEEVHWGRQQPADVHETEDSLTEVF